MRLRSLAIAILLAAGGVLVLVGATVVALGLLDPELVSSRIPDSVIDTPAVGGAMVALGSGTILLGLLHWGVVAAISLRVRGAATTAVVLSAGMAVLAFGFAVAAFVSALADTAPLYVMLPAGIGLLVATLAYALATGGLIGSARPPG